MALPIRLCSELRGRHHQCDRSPCQQRDERKRGLREIVGAAGSIGGLLAESALYTSLGSHALAITALLPLAAIAACVLVWFVPETARRELEAIAPERH